MAEPRGVRRSSSPIGDGGNELFNQNPTNYSVNPFVLAASNGQVYVAYTTGLSYQQSYCQPSGCYPYGVTTMDVMVANTTGGTGSWTVQTAAKNTPFDYYSGSGSYYSEFPGIAPQIAYNGLNGQLYVVYDSLEIGTFCYTSPTYNYCYTNEYEEAGRSRTPRTRAPTGRPPSRSGTSSTRIPGPRTSSITLRSP